TRLADLAHEPRRAAEMHSLITQTSGPAQANAVMRTLRILYRFGRRQAAGRLPAECATSAVTFHPERRRNTALGFGEIAGWHKERRSRLSHWAGDLRQTFRTTAQMIGVSDTDVRLLMNHAIPGISGGYITRENLLSNSLLAAQQCISSTLVGWHQTTADGPS